MFNFQDLLSGDFSAYPEETQLIMKEYNDKLRENIKDELVKDMSDRMLKDIDKSNEAFINVLTEILENGCKGYNKMSTRALLNLYLESHDEESFMKLLEKINM